ncbi:hypothetical protein [Moorena sp. SIO3H5]|uniref:hypothetical protein n=1 Tax=Moorena sp. SIO3H5 TaxID=2607834 RepID=UPI0013B81FD6|nr:hypothetical protein [Moorena sp. SIO3H5]NEO72701.1 hypothetical protein [Moorena sp. SIO3H5]
MIGHIAKAVSGQYSALSTQQSVLRGQLFYSKAPQVAMQRAHGGNPQERLHQDRVAQASSL